MATLDAGQPDLGTEAGRLAGTRVLHVTANERAQFFSEQTRALDAAGIEQTVLEVPGRYYETQATDGSRSPRDYLELYPDVLRRSFGDYDLIHANCGTTGPVAVAQPNLPVVLSLWGSDLMGSYGRLSEVAARFSDEVVVMTEEMRRELGRPCAVVPHGVDSDRFAPEDGTAARSTVDWQPDALHVLFPYAPDRDVKDFPRAARVVERVRERRDRPVVLHTLSGVPHEEMATYYAAADALLVTSRREGSPNTVKEALVCNLPVVATDVGDVRSVLADVEGSAVGTTNDELADALDAVIDRELRSDGRRYADEVSLERMADRLLAVYDRVLAD